VIVPNGLKDGGLSWPVRASITVTNFTEEDRPDYPVYVDVQMLMQRLFNEVDETTTVQLTYGNRPVPYLKTGYSLLFRQDIPPLDPEDLLPLFRRTRGEGLRDHHL